MATYTARDPEDDPITTWSLSGRDGGQFSIGQDGRLRFARPPNYEAPADADRNNVYEVKIHASDGPTRECWP